MVGVAGLLGMTLRTVPARHHAADVRALIGDAYYHATKLLERLERLARIDAGRMLLWRQVAMVTRRVRHAIGRLQP